MTWLNLNQINNFQRSTYRLSRLLTSVAKSVKIVEVSPRDGLQNETSGITANDKVALINKLIDAGVRKVEVGAFVSPKAVPQMADSSEVLQRLRLSPKTSQISVLVPNKQGLERAMTSFSENNTLESIEVAVFGSASESFSQRNIACSINESVDRFREVIQIAKQNSNISGVRGYVSCVLGCPYEGEVNYSDVARVSERLVSIGIDEISLGDTIGVGTPRKTVEMIRQVKAAIGDSARIAVHFHDTYGQALANIYASIVEEDIDIVDSSVAGIGGCPYAPGATGNVATEEVVYMLHGMGFYTGIDIKKLVDTGHFISQKLGRRSRSKVAQALTNPCGIEDLITY